MAALTFQDARACVLARLAEHRATPAAEIVPLDRALGRVLAEPVLADRDDPPLARSMRDGFAARAADLPGTLRITGEVRAGQVRESAVAQGEAIEIMTGAAVPEGADAVVMVEHARRDNGLVTLPAAAPGANINARGVQARAGETLAASGRRIGYAEIAVLAATGRIRVAVYRRPEIAILSTGDEVVAIDEMPRPEQVRNSNAHSLAAQVTLAGGLPLALPVARDQWDATLALIERGLAADLLLVSGGVSAGKYDIVERVLASLGAEFFFDRVLIQPGQPLVFGRARGRFFFGLPGNPASTMVTFALFARTAVESLGGCPAAPLPLLHARLRQPFHHKPGLTRFLPARLSDCGGWIEAVPWRGSADIAALARANAFLVADASRESWDEGEWIRVLLR